MKAILCPECGANNKKGVQICPTCGCPLQRKKKSWLVALIVCFFVAATFATIAIVKEVKEVKEEKLHQQQLMTSQIAFEQAVSFEEIYDYETAIYYFTQVISDDQENYIVAIEKIPELSSKMAEGKFVALAYVALKNTNITNNLSEISNIMTNVEKQIITCEIKGVSYSITGPDTSTWWLIASLDEYYTERTDAQTGFKITEYKPEYMYNGWLTTSTNSIRQQTSDVIFDSAREQTTALNAQIGLVAHYIELYEDCGDLSILNQT